MSGHDSHRRILLISGHAETALQIASPMADQGFDVVLSASLSQGRHELLDRDFELVLLDFEEQGESALKLLRDIRRVDDDVALPVIVLIPGGSSVLAGRALHAGANRCLPKPASVSVLVACAEVVLGEAAVLRIQRREQVLLDEIEAVDDALQVNERVRRSGEWVGTPSTNQSEIFHTGQYTAATAGPDGERSGNRPGDTAEQATTDWALFKAIEHALSRSLERNLSLSVVMLSLPGNGSVSQDHEAVAEILAAKVPRDASVQRLEPALYCVVLPEVGERSAQRIARSLLSAMRRAEEVGHIETHGPVNAGVATLPPDFEGSPFRLIDQAHQALARASVSTR